MRFKVIFFFCIAIGREGGWGEAVILNIEFGKYFLYLFFLDHEDFFLGLGDLDAKSLSVFPEVFHLEAFVDLHFEFW